MLAANVPRERIVPLISVGFSIVALSFLSMPCIKSENRVLLLLACTHADTTQKQHYSLSMFLSRENKTLPGVLIIELEVEVTRVQHAWLKRRLPSYNVLWV